MQYDINVWCQESPVFFFKGTFSFGFSVSAHYIIIDCRKYELEYVTISSWKRVCLCIRVDIKSWQTVWFVVTCCTRDPIIIHYKGRNAYGNNYYVTFQDFYFTQNRKWTLIGGTYISLRRRTCRIHSGSLIYRIKYCIIFWSSACRCRELSFFCQSVVFLFVFAVFIRGIGELWVFTCDLNRSVTFSMVLNLACSATMWSFDASCNKGKRCYFLCFYCKIILWIKSFEYCSRGFRCILFDFKLTRLITVLVVETFYIHVNILLKNYIRYNIIN